MLKTPSNRLRSLLAGALGAALILAQFPASALAEGARAVETRGVPLALGAAPLLPAAGSAAALVQLPATRLDAAPAGSAEASAPAPAAEGAAAAAAAATTSEAAASGSAAPGSISGRLQATVGSARATWERLRWIFDGTPDIAASEPATAPLPEAAARLRLLIVQQGRAPVSTTLAGLRRGEAGADFAARFNEAGHLRLVLHENDDHPELLQSADGPAVVAALESAGLKADTARRARIERLALAKLGAGPAQERQAASSRETLIRRVVGFGAAAAFHALAGPQSWIASVFVGLIAMYADRIPREAAFLARALKASFTESKRPTAFESVAGLLWKAPPFLINVFGIYVSQYAGHPVALAAVVALSFSLDLFHGVFIDTWNTLQGKIGGQRGGLYQGVFNFVYGQFWGIAFRLIAFTALAGVAGPWSDSFWASGLGMAVVGTIFGTLGWSGLNALYNKGALSRGQRSSLQAIRDVFFMVSGAYFGTGQLLHAWGWFAAQQVFDYALYLWNGRTATRPVIYVADARLAARPEFAAAYPPRAATIREALGNLKHLVFVKPFVALFERLKRLR